MEQAVRGALKDTFLLEEVRRARWKQTCWAAGRLAPQGERSGCSRGSTPASPAEADRAAGRASCCSLWRS